MANPLFQAMGGSQPNNMMNMVRQFQQFRQTFQGDPKAEVEKLLQSGRISQADLDRAQQMARQLQMFLR